MNTADNKTIVNRVLSADADGGQIKPGSKFIQLRTMIGEGDQVAAQWTGGFETISGFEYQNQYHVAFELRNGSITAIREYNDTQYMKEAFFS